MIEKTPLRNRIRPFEDIKRLAQEQEIEVSLKTEETNLSAEDSNISDENLIRFDHQRMKWVK
jgi:hypothetical protein